MSKLNFKPLLIALGLSFATSMASAHLVSSKTVLKSSDSAVISVRFDHQVSGDLYIATMVDGKLYFFSSDGKLTADKVAYQVNGTFKNELRILNISATGIPANHYPLYQVVVKTGQDVLNISNWVDGLAGLHRLNFYIGMPRSVSNDNNDDGFSDDDSDRDGYRDNDHDLDGQDDNCQNKSARKRENENEQDDDRSNQSNSSSCSGSLVTTTPTPTAVVTPTPKPTSTPTPTTTPTTTGNVGAGKALYTSLSCASCHGSNPSLNQRRILRGKSLSEIRSAIKNNPGDMGYLSSSSDADLQAIADYLNTF